MVEADEIEGDALSRLERCGIDTYTPRAGCALVVGTHTLGVDTRIVERGPRPRCRRLRNGRYMIEVPRRDPRRVQEDIGHELGEHRLPQLVSAASGYDRIEEDSIHYGDALCMPAPAFRIAYARAPCDLAWLARVFGAPETAVVRRVGELIRPTVLVVRGRIAGRWQCDGLDWLTDRAVFEMVLGEHAGVANVLALSDTPRSYAVFLYLDAH